MTTLMQHVTFNTSHIHSSNRFEFHKETIEKCKELIQSALEVNKPLTFPIDNLSHLHFGCVREGQDLIVTVYGPLGPHIKGEEQKGSQLAPFIIFGICSNENSSLWNLLITTYKQIYKKDPEVNLPISPWLGVILLPAFSFYTEAIDLIANFEQCMAWSWIEYLKTE